MHVHFDYSEVCGPVVNASDFNVLDEKATVAYLQVVLVSWKGFLTCGLLLLKKSLLLVSSCFSESVLCLCKVHC